MNRNKWNPEEIIYLTKVYHEGKRIKAIANELNRSSMSVSKALDRFNIKSSLCASNSNSNVPKKIQLPRVREIQKRFYDDWISIKWLFKWMLDNDFNLIVPDKPQTLYKLDNIQVTMGQVLLNCNRVRLNNNLPVFRVKGITDV